MRLLRTLVLFFLLAGCAAVVPAPTPVLDSSVTAARLIRASLTERLVRDASNHYRSQVVAMLAAGDRPADELTRVVDEELAKLSASEHDRLVAELVPVYLKHFTAEELQQLMVFYETPVARKSMQASPQIAADSQAMVIAWSEQFGETLLSNIDTRLSAAPPSPK